MGIAPTDTVMDVISKLSQGNPGALRVCCEILQSDPQTGFVALLDMDDMGMAGPSIWIGYKDYAGESLDKFKKALRDRDPAMVATINRNGGSAVTGGASYRR